MDENYEKQVIETNSTRLNSLLQELKSGILDYNTVLDADGCLERISAADKEGKLTGYVNASYAELDHIRSTCYANNKLSQEANYYYKKGNARERFNNLCKLFNFDGSSVSDAALKEGITCITDNVMVVGINANRTILTTRDIVPYNQKVDIINGLVAKTKLVKIVMFLILIVLVTIILVMLLIKL